MANRHELEQLRALARKRHQAATRKVKRLSNVRDVDIAGSRFDPRRDLAGLKRYNTAQVMAYIRKLDSFLDRSNQFVGDAKRRPIPIKEWQQYQRIQNQYNQGASAVFDDIKNIRLPSGMTVGQREATLKSDHPLAGNPSVSKPHAPVVKQPFNIASRDKLKDLIKDLKHKMSASYDKRQLEQDRSELRQIMAVVKDPKLEAKISSLSARQFNVLWNYTNFVTAASFMYEMLRDKMTTGEEPWQAERIRAKFEQAIELVDFASKL
jgi:hypothetical protein